MRNRHCHTGQPLSIPAYSLPGAPAMMTSCQAEYRQFVVDSIRLYKSLPALWDVRSKEYRDREKKMESYDILVRKFREMYPDANREMVKKKFNILRTNFRKELKRVLVQKHHPNLWYFQEFSFLNGLEETTNHDGEGNTELTIQAEHRIPLSYADAETPPLSIYEEPRRFPKQESTSGDDDGDYSTYFPTTTAPMVTKEQQSPHESISWEQSGEFQAVGFNVGAKLQKMDVEQQIYAELLINKVLARGRLGTLTKQTDLMVD